MQSRFEINYSKSILLIEDDALIALLEIGLLQDHGYRVSHVLSGEDAIGFINSNQSEIDLILIDIDLGEGIDGAETAQEILKIKDIPIVFLSSHTEKEIVEKTERITSYGYVVKNSGITVLDASIKMAFKLYEAHKREQEKELALIDMEERLRLTLQSTEQGLYDLNIQTGETIVNEQYAEMLGYDPKSFIETNAAWLSRLHPEDYKAVGQCYHDYINGLISEYKVEFRQRTFNGSYKWILSLGKIVAYDEDKKPLRMLGTHTDISRQKQLEEDLKKNIDSLDSIIQAIPSGLFVYEFQAPDKLILLDGNQEANRITGLDINQWRGKEIQEIFPEVFNTGILEKYLNVIYTGNMYEIDQLDYCDERINGAFRVRAFKLPYDRLGIAFENITEKKQAEDELKLKNQAIESSINAIALADAKGELTYVNPAFLKMWAYKSSSEIIGMSSLEFWDKKNMAEEVQSTIMRKGFYQGELVAKKSNGERFHTILTASSIFNQEGNPQYLMASFVDISERKKLEETQLFLIHCDTKASDEDFFKAIAKYLYDTTAMDYVCIDSLDKHNINAKTLGIYYDGEFEDNLTYSLKDTPCADVVGNTICCFKQNVRKLFPKDKILQEMKAESYIGTTLWDSSGNAKGLIALISRKPLEDTTFLESVLNIVAIKTASEIERREIENDLRILVQQKELLMKELQHRVKNNLNVISSLLSLELSRIDNDNTRLTYISTINRIHSMSSIYEKLYASDNLKQVELSLYIKDLVNSIYQSYCIDPCRIIITMNIEDVYLETKRAIPLGLILNELITNSLKYAYSENENGILSVDLRNDNGEIEIRIADQGKGYDQEEVKEKTKSIGLMLVKMLSEQIKARLITDSSKGVCTKIIFKL